MASENAKAFLAYAEAHYNEGWDTVVECMTLDEIDEEVFSDYVIDGDVYIEGYKTLEEAIDFYKESIIPCWEERRSTAWI